MLIYFYENYIFQNKTKISEARTILQFENLFDVLIEDSWILIY